MEEYRRSLLFRVVCSLKNFLPFYFLYWHPPSSPRNNSKFNLEIINVSSKDVMLKYLFLKQRSWINPANVSFTVHFHACSTKDSGWRRVTVGSVGYTGTRSGKWERGKRWRRRRRWQRWHCKKGFRKESCLYDAKSAFKSTKS